MMNYSKVLSDEEKQQLLRVAEQTLSAELTDELDAITYESTALTEKIDIAKRKLEKDVNEH